MPKKGRKAKNPKRVAAGKRAWAKMSAATKAARIRVLKGGRAGGKAMGKRLTRALTARGTRTKRQGVVSWLTSLIALIIAFFPAWAQLSKLISGEFNLEQTAGQLNRFYNPLSGDREALKAGYGSMVGGLLFKIVSSEVTKRAKIRSIIPALHA